MRWLGNFYDFTFKWTATAAIGIHHTKAWLSQLRGWRYETIEMKEAVTKVIDMLTQEDFPGAFQKLLEWYKCIAPGGDYFKGD